MSHKKDKEYTNGYYGDEEYSNTRKKNKDYKNTKYAKKKFDDKKYDSKEYEDKYQQKENDEDIVIEEDTYEDAIPPWERDTPGELVLKKLKNHKTLCYAACSLFCFMLSIHFYYKDDFASLFVFFPGIATAFFLAGMCGSLFKNSESIPFKGVKTFRINNRTLHFYCVKKNVVTKNYFCNKK